MCTQPNHRIALQTADPKSKHRRRVHGCKSGLSGNARYVNVGVKLSPARNTAPQTKECAIQGSGLAAAVPTSAGDVDVAEIGAAKGEARHVFCGNRNAGSGLSVGIKAHQSCAAPSGIPEAIFGVERASVRHSVAGRSLMKDALIANGAVRLIVIEAVYAVFGRVCKEKRFAVSAKGEAVGAADAVKKQGERAIWIEAVKPPRLSVGYGTAEDSSLRVGDYIIEAELEFGLDLPDESALLALSPAGNSSAIFEEQQGTVSLQGETADRAATVDLLVSASAQSIAEESASRDIGPQKTILRRMPEGVLSKNAGTVGCNSGIAA